MIEGCGSGTLIFRDIRKLLFFYFLFFSVCRQPGCEAGIREETFEPVETGAGLKLFAECNMGHRTSFSTCEFFNHGRTSVTDVKISALQLVTGLSMTQGCQHVHILGGGASSPSFRYFLKTILTGVCAKGKVCCC